MKILLDMNLSPRWAALLEGADYEAAHWSALGAADASDLEIMAFAKANDFVVITHDLDYSATLAATQNEKPSVVQIRSEDVSPEAAGIWVIAALRRASVELAEVALLTVEPGRARLRILPLRSQVQPT
ncbi:MAG: DUF5615 family PIN-like protein [Pseudomonadota bacterium]